MTFLFIRWLFAAVSNKPLRHISVSLSKMFHFLPDLSHRTVCFLVEGKAHLSVVYQSLLAENSCWKWAWWEWWWERASQSFVGQQSRPLTLFRFVMAASPTVWGDDRHGFESGHTAGAGFSGRWADGMRCDGCHDGIHQRCSGSSFIQRWHFIHQTCRRLKSTRLSSDIPHSSLCAHNLLESRALRCINRILERN